MFTALYNVLWLFGFGFVTHCNESERLLGRAARVDDSTLVFERVLTAFAGVALCGGYVELVSQRSDFSAL